MTKISLRILAEKDDKDPMCCASTCPHLLVYEEIRRKQCQVKACRIFREKLLPAKDGSVFRTKACLEYETKPEVIDSMTLVSDDLAYRVAFGSICEASKDAIKDYSLEDKENIRLEFYLNGIRTDILPFFKRVEEIFDSEVAQEARILVRDKFNTLSDLFRRLENVVLEDFPNINDED